MRCHLDRIGFPERLTGVLVEADDRILAEKRRTLVVDRQRAAFYRPVPLPQRFARRNVNNHQPATGGFRRKDLQEQLSVRADDLFSSFGSLVGFNGLSIGAVEGGHRIADAQRDEYLSVNGDQLAG